MSTILSSLEVNERQECGESDGLPGRGHVSLEVRFTVHPGPEATARFTELLKERGPVAFLTALAKEI